MTIETKTTIEADDITTVEFECRTCHSIRTFPLEVADHPPMACQCSQDHRWMALGNDMYCGISDLITLLQRFSKAKNEPFVMRFGIKHDAALGRASESKA